MNSTVSLIHIAMLRIAVTWPWYIVRGAGFVAVFLLIILMLSGIGLVTGHMYRIFEPAKAWIFHRTVAIALCFSIAIHISFLLIDHSLPFKLSQILIPFTSTYKTVWVALGVFAMYGVAIVVASSLGWINTKKRAWKNLHFLSYAIMALVFLHALYTGTDLAYGLFRRIWIYIGLILGFAILVRVWRAGTLKKEV